MEPLNRGLPPPDPRSVCPQLNLLNPPSEKIPGYATDRCSKFQRYFQQTTMSVLSSGGGTIVFQSDVTLF
jgi:hypothetical protein